MHTAGLRSGEVFRLKLADYNPEQRTLLIRDSKFYKTRIVPLSRTVAETLNAFLELRLKTNLPMEATSALIWNRYGDPKGKAYRWNGFAYSWLALCAIAGVLTQKGKPPRMHDLRHSFAVNALQRWYEAGEDVQAKLPLLSAYMGHANIASTYQYMSFVDGIRSQANNRFQQSFGNVITLTNEHNLIKNPFTMEVNHV